MIIYLSMMAWVCLMRFLCNGSLQHLQLPNGARYYKAGKPVAFLTMAYLIFWIGMRTSFVDTEAYIGMFRVAPGSLSAIPQIVEAGGKSPTWGVMTTVFKALISDNAQAWLMFQAVVTGLAVAACYRRYSEAFFLSLLIFMLGGTFTWMMNGIRQFLAVVILMLATPWLLKGKTIHYMLLIAAVCTIHMSAIIMVPIYFVARQKPWGKITLLAILGTALVCYGASFMAGLAESALESTAYAGKSLVMQEEDDGAHPLRAVVAAVPALLALLMKRQLEAENNPVINVGINMSILGTLVFAFATFTSGIVMGRLPIYCTMYAPITLTLLFNRINTPILRKLMVVGCILGYTSFFYLLYRNSLYYMSDITGFVF